MIHNNVIIIQDSGNDLTFIDESSGISYFFVKRNNFILEFLRKRYKNKATLTWQQLQSEIVINKGQPRKRNHVSDKFFDQ